MSVPKPEPSTDNQVAEDKSLIDRLRHNKPGAWGEFLLAYGDLIYDSVYYTLKKHNFRIPDSDVEDAVQDVFEKLMEDNCRRLLTYKGENGCSLGGWLRTVCVRHTLELIRRTRATVSLDEVAEEQLWSAFQDSAVQESTVREEIDLERAQQVLQEAVQQLPARERLVFQLYYEDECKSTEIAEIIGIKSNHVDQLLYRIRQKLASISQLQENFL